MDINYIDSSINLNSYDKIIILTYGRVGSQSLEKSLLKLNLKCHIHQGHRFQKKYFGLTKDIDNKVLIITIIRNFYDRNISALFEFLTTKKRLWLYDIDEPIDWENIDLDDLSNHYNQRNPIVIKDFLDNWYDSFQEISKIDIYSKPFSHDDKYIFYPANAIGNISVLVLRFEDIEQWETIVNKLFNVDFKLEKHRTGSAKLYNPTMKRFREKYSYNQETISLINNLKMMKHFYTENELSSFVKKYNK